MLTNTRSRVTNVAHSTPTIYLEQLSASDGRQQLHELLEGRHGHGKAGLESSRWTQSEALRTASGLCSGFPRCSHLSHDDTRLAHAQQALIARRNPI